MPLVQLRLAGERAAGGALEAFQVEARPDHVGRGLEVRCDPGFPDAWRKQPFRNELREWAISGETLDMTVVVIAGQRMTLVTPDREFDLGIVGPDERIVRELEDGKVVNVTVAKASDLER
ncbi:hypothetical protein [Bradyrhizobium brasilense]|nr:hypothetical protein [Bradyrhizobium brasilense]